MFTGGWVGIIGGGCVDGGGDDGQPLTQSDPQCASLYPQKPHTEQHAPLEHVDCAEHSLR